MPQPPFSDPALQTFTIDDFTPGIHRGNRVLVTPSYAPKAPPGSCAHSYRCYAKPEIGLIPFPAYELVQTYTQTDATHPLCISLGNMKTLAPRGGALFDIVQAYLVIHGTATSGGLPVAPTDFHVTRCAVTSLPASTPTTVYTSTSTASPLTTSSWPNMDYGLWKDPTTGRFARTVITTDPISTSPYTNGGSATGKWVSVRSNLTPATGATADSNTGTFPLLGPYGAYPGIFYHENRMAIWELDATITTDGFVATDSCQLFVSNILNPTGIVSAGTFFAEMGTSVGTWGSWSTGELLAIYAEGGGVLVYGDLFAPSSVVKLPGLPGPSFNGPGALSPIGFIYPGADGFVYLWNGDNTVTNLSRNIPELAFNRYEISAPFWTPQSQLSTQTVWGEFVIWPHNWLFDTATQAWWLAEDPGVIDFQVFAEAIGGTGSYCVAAPGVVIQSNPGQPCVFPTYAFNKNTEVSSYFWQSNPIPVTTGALVNIAGVEIVASNLGPTYATVKVQPTSPQGAFFPTINLGESSDPPGTIPFQNANDNLVTFEIPPHTSGYRASKRLGYTDYNVQFSLTAANSNANNGAPTIHSITIYYHQTRTSGVQ